jgi:alpha-1,3-rhamnosyl/mannosyltransferase
VITSNVSSLPEISAGSGVLVDPASASDIASAIERLLTSPSVRHELASCGTEVARKYTWKNAARQSCRFFAAI